MKKQVQNIGIQEANLDRTVAPNADFYQEFADSLSLFDDVILTDIYPARELPIPGVTSQLIADNLKPGVPCTLCLKGEVTDIVRQRCNDIEILVLLGAGDLESQANEITDIMKD